MEPSSFYYPSACIPLMPEVDSVSVSLPQNASNLDNNNINSNINLNEGNLKWEDGHIPVSHLHDQHQLQPTLHPSPSAVLSLRQQPFRPSNNDSNLDVYHPPLPPAQQTQARTQLQLQSYPRHSPSSYYDAQETRPTRVVKQSGSVLTLACLNCRAKKIKCQPENGGCKKCKRLGIPCPGPEVDERKRPSSKRYIRELHNRIEELEKNLRESQYHRNLQAREIMTLYDLNNQFHRSYPKPSINRPFPTNIISRLCDGRYQLDGTIRYAGPTSSLHLALDETNDNEAWSALETWGGNLKGSPDNGDFEVDPDTEDYLLNLYWKYQHTELQVFHKGAFERDMAAGKTQFYSKALLYCVMACAARISSRPEIRAMVLPPDTAYRGKISSPMAGQQCLFAAASRLLEEERKQPQITTIQSLLLLSVIYCAFSNDMKGLSLTSAACRLAIELGLHRDPSNLNLPQIDVEARQITFWGCVVFDRLWGLYLGRSFFLVLDETVTVPRLSCENLFLPWNCRLAGAWASLLELVGCICEGLNKNQYMMAQINSLSEQLYEWYRRLDPSLHYKEDGPPSVAVMHMQYCAATIILYRPLAGFGQDSSKKVDYADKFRQICVQHAIQIANYLADYRTYHRTATTLSGIALHIIETAATTFISDISERRKATDVSSEYMHLAVCVQTLLELEQTYLVAQKVRKILKKLINLCNLDSSRLKKILADPNSQLTTFLRYNTFSGLGSSTRLPVADGYSNNESDKQGSFDMPTQGDQHPQFQDPNATQDITYPVSAFSSTPYPQYTQRDIYQAYPVQYDQMYQFEQQ
ncbi:hypothetical protein AJ79_07135 [Helicocarpus griseus UAMH5409]|uniref:Zn(2)-C6 fungal-type domain-containing protein n=1 Tax=Helicocarpus griseus UAMH5409 TaxID=1447875 RepID=A0A2B7X6J4_9EURO|nr:hypothetical protein AJ79_07135 [Helicocarpus griseus UAMH5409]